MRAWLKLLFPLLVWALHFIYLYLVIEFLPERSISAAVLLTSLCVAALVVFWRLQRQAGGLPRAVATLGSLLSLTAIAAQSMPFIADMIVL
jgi:hypothetical protein